MPAHYCFDPVFPVKKMSAGYVSRSAEWKQICDRITRRYSFRAFIHADSIKIVRKSLFGQIRQIRVPKTLLQPVSGSRAREMTSSLTAAQDRTLRCVLAGVNNTGCVAIRSVAGSAAACGPVTAQEWSRRHARADLPAALTILPAARFPARPGNCPAGFCVTSGADACLR